MALEAQVELLYRTGLAACTEVVHPRRFPTLEVEHMAIMRIYYSEGLSMPFTHTPAVRLPLGSDMVPFPCIRLSCQLPS